MDLKARTKQLLLWSQKYTQTDMLYLTKGGFWLFLGQIVGLVANLLLIFVFANWLTKETFGTYKYVLSLLGILSIPSLLGLNTAVLNAAARNEDGAFLLAFKLKLKWGLWGSFGSLLLAFYYFIRANQILGVCFLIVALFLPFFNSLHIYESFLAGKKSFAKQNKYYILSQVLSLIFLASAAFLSNNIFILLLAYFFPLTIVYGIFFFLTKKAFRPQGKTNKETINFGKHMSLMGILSSTSSQIDKIILWHFLGPTPLAIYSITMMMPDKIKEILKIIGNLAMPKMVARPIAELQKTVPQKTLRLFAVALPVMLAYIIIAPIAFKWLLPQYYDYVFYSQIYALILLFFPRVLLGAVLQTKQKIKELYIATAILTPIYWLMLLFLTPTIGIWGAIVSFLILEMATFAINFIQFKKIKDS